MAEPATGQGEFLIVARVRRPHGVGGELLVAVDTDRPRHVFRPGRVLHLADAGGDPIGRDLRLTRMRPTTGGAILTLEGIASREAADGLRGHSLLIRAGEAQPAAGDEVHYRDLVGLTAYSESGEIGPVEDILEIPFGEILVIRGGGGREVLIPFVKEMIEEVDLGSRRLKLTVPEGLLEL
jgi:16S rRNA processing protein RimM